MLRIDRFQQQHGVLGFVIAVLQKFGNDEAGGSAALIAYYGYFALLPLLLLFTTIMGYALQGDEKLQNDLLESALGNFPIIGQQLRSPTQPLARSAVGIFVESLLLLYGAIGLGLATQRAMNKVWNVPYVRWPSFILRYLRAIAILGLIALATIGLTALTGFAALASHGWGTTALLINGSLAVNFVLFLTAFKLMTAKPYTWRDVALGAALASAFWQLLQLAGSWLVGRELQHTTASFGFFGIVLTLLAWIYLGAQLFLLAAEINVVYRTRLYPRSIVQPPLTPADKETFERFAQMAIRRPEVSIDVHFSPQADVERLDQVRNEE